MQADYWLVWIQGIRGPTPQKWARECFKTRPVANLIAKHPLSIAEADLPLKVLSSRYPAPASVMDGTDTVHVNTASVAD